MNLWGRFGSALCVAGMVVCSSLSQVLLKYAGLRSLEMPGLIGLLGNPWLWAAIFGYALGFFFWLLALRKLALAVAYPWSALSYVLPPLAGVHLFSEQLAPHYFLGVGMIVVGMTLITTGGLDDTE